MGLTSVICYLFPVQIVPRFFPLSLCCTVPPCFWFSVCVLLFCFVLWEREFLPYIAHTDHKLTTSGSRSTWITDGCTHPFLLCVNIPLHIAISPHKHSDELFIRIIINVLMHTNLIYINYYWPRFKCWISLHSCLPQLQAFRLSKWPWGIRACSLWAYLLLLYVTLDRLRYI